MTIKEIFTQRGIKPGGILHVGAAMLEEAQDYKDMGVETVIWVEAAPEDQTRYERACLFGHVLYDECALGEENGKATFRVASNGHSSSILPFARHSQLYPDIIVTEEIEVPMYRADHLFKHFPPEIDTLVLDVQGAELMVLKGMGKLLEQIKWIHAEVSLTELYQGQALKPALDQWLKEHGFPRSEFFEVHISEWGEEIFYRE